MISKIHKVIDDMFPSCFVIIIFLYLFYFPNNRKGKGPTANVCTLHSEEVVAPPLATIAAKYYL